MITDAFTVEYHPHGMAIRGSIPLSSFTKITKLAADRDPSWTMMDVGISRAIGVTFVIGSSESLSAWRAEIEAELAATQPDPVTRWLLGTDTGVSSRWLLACIVGSSSTVEPRDRSLPRDAGDFGRCSRMLDATGLRPRLAEAGAHGEWARILPVWDTLEKLLAANAHSELTGIIREIDV